MNTPTKTRPSRSKAAHIQRVIAALTEVIGARHAAECTIRFPFEHVPLAIAFHRRCSIRIVVSGGCVLGFEWRGYLHHIETSRLRAVHRKRLTRAASELLSDLNPIPTGAWGSATAAIHAVLRLQLAARLSPTGVLPEWLTTMLARDKKVADRAILRTLECVTGTFTGESLAGPFVWAETPEGNAYWSHVHNSLVWREIPPLPC